MRSDFPLNLDYIVGEPNYYKFRDIFLASSDLRPMSLNVLLGITNRTYCNVAIPCLWSRRISAGRSFPSLPGSLLVNFYRDDSLTTRQPIMVDSFLAPPTRLGRKLLVIAHGSAEFCEATPIGLADVSKESLYGRETDRDLLSA